MEPRPGGKGSCGGQGRARRHCGANPPEAGVPYLPTVEPAATRPQAGAGVGGMERGREAMSGRSERRAGRAVGATPTVRPEPKRPPCGGAVSLGKRSASGMVFTAVKRDECAALGALIAQAAKQRRLGRRAATG